MNEKTVSIAEEVQHESKGSSESDKKVMGRREFLKKAGAAGAVAVASYIGKASDDTGEIQKVPEKEEVTKRVEHFKPFDKGYSEWQYLEFQYTDSSGETFGVTISLGTSRSLFDVESHDLLVSKVNMMTGEVFDDLESGSLSFDESNLEYVFKNESGEKTLCSFKYDNESDVYLLNMNTDVYSTGDEGLFVVPLGRHMEVSKDASFTVVDYEGGEMVTNYFADNVLVAERDSEGKLVTRGYGRRDSENLEVVGDLPEHDLDVDHNWIHTTFRVEDKMVFATVWNSTNNDSGSEYKFVDFMVLDSEGKEDSFISLNEEDANFDVQVFAGPSDLEQVADVKYIRGGTVKVVKDGKTFLNLKSSGLPGQTVRGGSRMPGFVMTEAHFKTDSAEGEFMGASIDSFDSGIFESTTEIHTNYLPMVSSS